MSRYALLIRPSANRAYAGLDPMDTGPYLAFRHRVDQAISRDILAARKP